MNYETVPRDHNCSPFHGFWQSFISIRHLQRTYSARETNVMQGLEKHNLTRITNAPAAFLI